MTAPVHLDGQVHTPARMSTYDVFAQTTGIGCNREDQFALFLALILWQWSNLSSQLIIYSQGPEMQNKWFPYRVGGAPGVGGHKRGKNSQFFSGDRPYIIGTGRDGT